MVNAITIDRIVDATAKHFHISRSRILSKSRLREDVRPRQVAMYLARQLTDYSFPRIALCFGRDHSTVHAALARITGMVETSTAIRIAVDSIRYELVCNDR